MMIELVTTQELKALWFEQQVAIERMKGLLERLKETK